MATTTNYGWTTPDDTALVKDGASAIRTLGSSIDTTTKALNPSTTLGDIEYRSSTANTNTRLGIGSTGQVLTVASGVPTWANAGGGQFKEQVFTSTNASYTIPSGITGFWAVLAGGGGGGGGCTSASAYNGGAGGGAGQVLETYFTISGDTTLNITIGAGGAGGTAGGKGSNGSTTSIVGNTSSTTYASAIGGGGGGGSGSGNTAGLTGASGGGNGNPDWEFGTAGGGAGWHAYAYDGATIQNNGQATNFAMYGGGGAATLLGSTGHSGGNCAVNNPSTGRGGYGVVKFGRLLGGGGTGAWLSTSPAVSFGGGYGVSNAAGTAGTANTGGGGGGAGNNGTAANRNGGNGGSGIVIIRWVG